MLFLFYYVLLADLSNDDHHFNVDHDNFMKLQEFAFDFYETYIFGDHKVALAAVTELYREWVKILERMVEEDNKPPNN